MYIVFLLLLPFETPKWLLLLLSFAMGITIDIFSDTPGMHTSATVFLGFLRPYILKSISPREGYESATEPRIKNYGVNWFVKYTLILTFLHHSFLFGVEIFRFSGIFFIIARTLLSTIFTTFLIVISQYFINRRS
jgi:rod shape-determining protein MreD